jgi:hypothetical protein
VCGQLVFFTNSRCLRGNSALSYEMKRGEILAFLTSDEPRYQRCANSAIAECNWLVPSNRRTGPPMEPAGCASPAG